MQRKLDELRALGEELKALRAKLATGRAGELAAAATDGVVVERVDGLETNELRELALAVRSRPGVLAVVLAGVTPAGGVGLVAAVAPDDRGPGVGAAQGRRQGGRRRRRRQGRRGDGRRHATRPVSARRCASPATPRGPPSTA